MRDLTYQEWEEEFNLLLTVDTDDLAVLRQYQPQCIWTFVDSSGEGSYIINGARWINRIEYYITEKPWAEDFIFVRTR